MFIRPELLPDSPFRDFTHDVATHVGWATQDMKRVSPKLIKSCDLILQNHPHGIGIIGTGGRGAYSVMRRLALHLPNRGEYKRVKLLDVSRLLLFGIEHPWAKELSYGSEEHALAYMKRMDLLKHDEILLIDTGFKGRVVKALARIIHRAFPEKKVKLLLFSPNFGHRIMRAPGITEDEGRDIAEALEYGKSISDLSIKPANRQTSDVFVKWGHAWRPKYYSTNKLSQAIAVAKHQVLLSAVQEYVAKHK